jgi:hypothetical protein
MRFPINIQPILLAFHPAALGVDWTSALGYQAETESKSPSPA